MIVNRIADLFFTIGILTIFCAFQTVEFNGVFGLSDFFIVSVILFANTLIHVLSLIATLLFLGAMGKSAQIGLHT